MHSRSIRAGYVLALACLLSCMLCACGGGGDSGASSTGLIDLTSVQVTTQAGGPLAPFGSTAGGDEVKLHGRGFSTGADVLFGNVVASVKRVITGEITVTAPASREGLTSITITNPNGDSATFPDVFRYIAPPGVTRLNIITGPTAGEDRVPIAGGETLEIEGTNFKNGLQLFVNGSRVTATFVDERHARFRAPASPSEASVDVQVTNPEGLMAVLPLAVRYTQEFSLAVETGGFPERHARHLFRRAAFGATPARIAQAVSDGLSTTVGGLMGFSNDDTVEDAALAVYGGNPPPRDSLSSRLNRRWWIHMLIKNSNPFQERLAWFLHDHFATSDAGFAVDANWFFYKQVQLFRRFSLATSDATGDGATGLAYNWRDMLIAVAKDRAMLEWLDGRVSRVGRPNENFARELWELFTLGEGNGYTEEDIQEAAKAFTGFEWWRDRAHTIYADDRLDMRYRSGRHDASEKTIFGVTGRFGYDSIGPLYWKEADGANAADYDAAVDTDTRDTDGGIVALTLRERPDQAAMFICRKLADFFLYDDPHDVVVKPLADQLIASNWNLEPVLRRMLLSRAMYSNRAIKGKVRNHVEFVFDFMRTANVDLHPTSVVINASRVETRLQQNLGQVPLQPPDVNGWPTGTAWLSSQGMLERVNFITYAIDQLDDFDLQIVPLIPPAGQRGATQLVDHLAKILDVQLSGSARAKAIAYVTTQESNGTTVPFAYNPSNDEHVKMKTRGLLFLIAQYHSGHQN